jgi:hypothetical protein
MSRKALENISYTFLYATDAALKFDYMDLFLEFYLDHQIVIILLIIEIYNQITFKLRIVAQ